MRQWFDDWHLRPELSGDFVSHRYDEGLQISGLGKTVRYLHDLVAQEAELVGGVQNVVLGGISQGCAASLVAALVWEGDDRLGAVVGMCGWLPYLTQMQEVMQAQGDSAGKVGEAGDDFELFERLTSPLASPSVAGSADAAVGWLRDELELPRIRARGLSMWGAEISRSFLAMGATTTKWTATEARLPVSFSSLLVWRFGSGKCTAGLVMSTLKRCWLIS
jgi:pimeloyl-ACP methyl ester carboxylesterase